MAKRWRSTYWWSVKQVDTSCALKSAFRDLTRIFCMIVSYLVWYYCDSIGCNWLSCLQTGVIGTQCGGMDLLCARHLDTYFLMFGLGLPRRWIDRGHTCGFAVPTCLSDVPTISTFPLATQKSRDGWFSGLVLFNLPWKTHETSNMALTVFFWV